MAHGEHEHYEHVIVDLVDDAVVACVHSPFACPPINCFAAGGRGCRRAGPARPGCGAGLTGRTCGVAVRFCASRSSHLRLRRPVRATRHLIGHGRTAGRAWRVAQLNGGSADRSGKLEGWCGTCAGFGSSRPDRPTRGSRSTSTSGHPRVDNCRFEQGEWTSHLPEPRAVVAFVSVCREGVLIIKLVCVHHGGRVATWGDQRNPAADRPADDN